MTQKTAANTPRAEASSRDARKVKVGRINLDQLPSGRFRAGWMDPGEGKKGYVRRTLPPDIKTMAQAKALAREMDNTLSSGRGRRIVLFGGLEHLIRDVAEQTVAASHANARTRAGYAKAFSFFTRFLDANFPNVKMWSDITEDMIDRYYGQLRDAGLAYDTVRQRIHAIRACARRMAERYPDHYKDITRFIRIERKGRALSPEKIKNALPSPDQYRAMLAFLKQQAPEVYLWSLLQGLCGLRVLEALYLREQDIDLGELTLTVAKSAAHMPKNTFSLRSIPIPRIVAQELEFWMANRKIRSAEGFIFCLAPARSNGAIKRAKRIEAQLGLYTLDTAMKRFSNAAKAARAAGVSVPPEFTARFLRKVFTVFMLRAGVDPALVDAYVGHAPNSVLRMHYDFIDTDRLRPLAELAQQLYNSPGKSVIALNAGAKPEAGIPPTSVPPEEATG